MSEWLWIDEAMVLAVHEQLLVRHGGAPGVRDLGLLRSALARPQQMAAYEDDTDVIALAAILTTGVIKNHPFIDGNKRTGFVAGILFLELNGAQFVASDEAATRAVLALASGTSGEKAYCDFLLANVTR